MFKETLFIQKTVSIACFLGLLFGVYAGNSFATLLFFDGFDAPAADVDRSVWETQEGSAAFFGQTAIRNPKSSPTAGLPSTIEVTNEGYARLRLDTFNPTDPAHRTFWGSEIDTIQEWKPSSTEGIRFEARVRNGINYLSGMITSVFSYGLADNGLTRDEIDFEFLTKQYINTIKKKIFVNRFNNEGFSSGGAGELIETSIDFTDWNLFRIDWTPQFIRWYVNDVKVATADANIPINEMGMRLNIWVPDQYFTEAYDSDLKAAISLSENQTFFYDVDFARVSSFTVVPEPATGIMFLLAMFGLCRKRVSGA